MQFVLQPFVIDFIIVIVSILEFRVYKISSSLAMDESGLCPLDETNEVEYASLSRLLHDFNNISTIDKAWTFNSDNAKTGTQVMFSTTHPNLLANKTRRCILTSHVSEQSGGSVSFDWAPFPFELTGVSAFVPSPSGSKLLIIRNYESESLTKFEIWVGSQVQKEFQIPHLIHGTVYQDGWFEGISWNYNETVIAYVAEEAVRSDPTFDCFGHKKGGSKDKDYGTWKGQGDWEEDWGETYTGKRRPTLFVININSGEVRAVEGIEKNMTAGQVVWAPTSEGLDQHLVFVGWSGRKFGVKYCQSRPCALYVVRAPFDDSEVVKASEKVIVVNLTQSISSALFPCFSPDGKFLVFLSAKSAVDSGAHLATNSLYRMEWPTDGKLEISPKLIEVVPVVMCAEIGCFPGLYCSSILSKPWLSDGCTMVVTSVWGSTRSILSINVINGNIERISPPDSYFSWNVLALDGDNVIAVSSSPVDVPVIKYGTRKEPINDRTWRWLEVSSPMSRCSEKVTTMLSTLQFSVMKIPSNGDLYTLQGGANRAFEAIFVSTKTKRSSGGDPLVVFLHGGPHDVSVTKFSKSLAFLSSLGYNLLNVNYRGSLGFGEEALQSLPGKVGTRDVNDILTAIDHVIDMGLADPSKITVIGGSHGGFLATHLIGQAPGKFVAAVAQNPVCNLALMVGTTDIPDWCYVEAFGNEGKTIFEQAPSPEHLALFHTKSPISHLDKVITPTLFLFGNEDRRVPVSTGLQYARALKEKGVEVKVMMFPNDVHEMDIPRTEFESYLNIGVWFNKYCK